MPPATTPKCLFSIDVEDWFHILDVGAPSIESWDGLPSRLESNFLNLLDILDEKDVRATCFFLGWAARKYPHLVRTAQARGHEIASHGYGHGLIYRMTADQFHDDAATAKKVLEDIAGEAVVGYRAAGFSLTTATPWLHETLSRAGYTYDSSLFPMRRGHGGMPGAGTEIRVISTAAGEIVEIPISTVAVLGRRISFFGGGYFRLYPAWLTVRMARRVLASDQPVVWYLHPREIDPDHPRLPMSLARRFKSYFNLKGTARKLTKVLGAFEWCRFHDYIKGTVKAEKV